MSVTYTRALTSTSVEVQIHISYGVNRRQLFKTPCYIETDVPISALASR